MIQWTSLASWEWVFQSAIDARSRSSFSSSPPPSSDKDGQQTPRDRDDERWIRASLVSQLPSFQKILQITTGNKKPKRPNCLLRVERDGDDENQNDLIVWFGGTAFDCLGDKDLLCIACNGYGSNLDSLVPKSVVVNWDCETEADFELPRSSSGERANNNSGEGGELFVLKPPLGCQGHGIGFYRSKAEILPIVRRDAAAARNETGFLDHLRATKGRIPGWVVQTYVPSMPVMDGRKFHVRAYVLVHEIGGTAGRGGETPAVYYYDDFEVRVASKPYSSDYTDRSAHVTNGAGGSETSRAMVGEIPELSGRTIRRFLGALFSEEGGGSALRRAVLRTPGADLDLMGTFASRVYCLAALDIMIDTGGRPWLLEVNAKCPAAPNRGLGSGLFQEHLVRFVGRLLDVALEQDMAGFVPL